MCWIFFHQVPPSHQRFRHHKVCAAKSFHFSCFGYLAELLYGVLDLKISIYFI